MFCDTKKKNTAISHEVVNRFTSIVITFVSNGYKMECIWKTNRYLYTYVCIYVLLYIYCYMYIMLYIYVYTRVYIYTLVCVQFTYICTVLFLYVTGVVWYEWQIADGSWKMANGHCLQPGRHLMPGYPKVKWQTPKGTGLIKW